MKFTAEASHLKQTLTRMVAVTERRATIPILQNTKLTVADNTATFHATDLDIEIKETIAVEASTVGSITVRADMFKEIVSKLDSGQLVELELKDQWLHIKSKGSKFKLNTLDAMDFPHIANDKFDTVLDFTADKLKSAIDRTIWSASTEETRYYLKGVALQNYEGEATFIATDGHRLSRYKAGDCAAFPNVIIPTKTAKQFSSALNGGDVKLMVSDTKVKMIYDNLEIISKLVDGTYPEWPRVIPNDLPHKVTASSLDLKQAVERVSTVTTERTKAIRVAIGNDSLSIHAIDAVNGEATDTIDAQCEGDEVTIGINGKYALDAMAQADKGNVVIHYKGAMDQMIVRYEKEDGLLCVLMPMRV